MAGGANGGEPGGDADGAGDDPDGAAGVLGGPGVAALVGRVGPELPHRCSTAPPVGRTTNQQGIIQTPQ